MGELDDEWREYTDSGFVPMILAGYRMSAVRRTFAGLEDLAKSITKDVESEAADLLAWSRAQENTYYPEQPEFFIDMAAQEGYADEMKAATDELPNLFFGSLIVYLLSTLEATLADCLELAQIVKGRRQAVRQVRNPKLENYVTALGDCGVVVSWSDEIWTNLRAWREVRNKFVHTLETRHKAWALSSSIAQEFFWLVDEAIRELDNAMSGLEPIKRQPL
jgi:hypothetical protein